MKRYDPSVNRSDECDGDCFGEVAEDPEGEYVRYDDVPKWHRNCAESPIQEKSLGTGLFIIVVLGRYKTMAWYEDRVCLWVSDDGSMYSPDEITHWMEIPELPPELSDGATNPGDESR